MKVNDDLEISIREKWLEILSWPDNQFISVGYEEIDPLIEALKSAKTQFADAPDKLLRYFEIIQLLDKEQSWGKAHYELVDPEYLKGFLAGLLRAKHLVTSMTQIEAA